LGLDFEFENADLPFSFISSDEKRVASSKNADMLI
jgi:hypothetical protein